MQISSINIKMLRTELTQYEKHSQGFFVKLFDIIRTKSVQKVDLKVIQDEIFKIVNMYSNKEK